MLGTILTVAFIAWIIFDVDPSIIIIILIIYPSIIIIILIIYAVVDFKSTEKTLSGLTNQATETTIIVDSPIIKMELKAKDAVRESINDQLRNEEKVTISGEQVCLNDTPCFDYKWRQHTDGTFYACEIDGINCYEVK